MKKIKLSIKQKDIPKTRVRTNLARSTQIQKDKTKYDRKRKYND